MPHPHVSPRARGSDLEVAYASSACGHKGIRLRRSRGSTGDGKIEFGEFINEDLRAGGPRMCSLPVERLRIPRSHWLYHKLQNDEPRLRVNGILASYNVEVTSIDIFLCRPQFNPEQDRTPTIVVSSTRTKIDKRWVVCCKEIYNYLSSHGIEASVEIAHPAVFEPYPLAPIEDSQILLKWEMVVKQIISQIELTDVTTIGCLRIQLPDESDKSATVLVTVKLESSRDWRETRETIITILDELQLSMLSVLIVKDELNSAVENKGFNQDLLDGISQPGGRIARLDHGDSSSSGSFGGFVQLQFSHDIKILGLTSYRCIHPENQNEITNERMAKFHHWDKHGMDLMELVDKPNPLHVLYMAQPGDAEMECQLQNNQERITQILRSTNYIRWLCREIMNTLVQIPRNQLQEYNALRTEITDLDTFSAEIKHFRAGEAHHLGHVIACSGFDLIQKNSNSVPYDIKMEWALIKTHKERIPSHHPTRIQSEIPHGNDVLFVHGCDGLSESRYAGTKTCHVFEREAEGCRVLHTSMEHTVVGDAFSSTDSGDTGSLIHFQDDRAVGMVTASLKIMKITYFTHVDDLFSNIRSRTGASEVQIMVPIAEQPLI